MSEQYLICGRRTCDWSGYKSEVRWLPVAGSSPVAGFREIAVCPKCGKDSFAKEKPLFIPLLSQYFDQFKDGIKDTECRLHGRRWNARTCRVGRRVILSRGYGKADRIAGVIDSVSYDNCPAVNIPGWVEIYGVGRGQAIRIRIKLNRDAPVHPVSISAQQGCA